MLKVLPWIGGAALLVLGAWFKEGLTSGLKKLTQLVYERMAGSPLLRRTALKRYARSVYQKYETFPVSFRVDDTLKMTMASVYVPLRLATRRDEGHSRTTATEFLAAERLNVVLGAPGSGKTMLLRSQMLAWAIDWQKATEGRRRRQRVGAARPSHIPVLLALHDYDVDRSLESYLADRFAEHDFPGAGRFVARALREGRLTVYFDGLDEVSTDRRTQVAERIIDFTRRHGTCPAVVTCRSAVYEGQFTEAFDQVLRVEEFDERLIRRFLSGWPWPPELATGTVEQLMVALRDTPQLMPLARNPLLLTMVAYLYTYEYAGTDQVLPHTRGDFYKEVTDNLLGHLKRGQNRFARGVKKEVLRDLALAIQDLPASARDRLTLPDAQVLDIVRATLAEQRRSADDAEAVLAEIVDRSGLLLRIDGGERYQFAHLTLQEYLAAERLAEDPARLIDRYRADTASWHEVIRLWCGVADRDCTEVVEAVWPTPILAFQCLADAHRVDDALATKIIEYFKGRLGAYEDDHEVAAAFGLVAADNRPRGVEVFDFLRSVAHTDGAGLRRDRAILALAATNDSRAVDAVAPLFGHVTAAAGALGSLGDRAIPAIAGRAQAYPAAAVSALLTIGTPRSALALADLLWTETEAAYEAAFALGCLLTDPDIETALHTAPRPADGLYLPWVWQPFANGPGDALVRIVGRIVWLLQQVDPATLPRFAADGPALDLRIALTFCVAGGDLKVRQTRASVSRGVFDEIQQINQALARRAIRSPFDDSHGRHVWIGELGYLLEMAATPQPPLDAAPVARIAELEDELLRAADVPDRAIARLALLAPHHHIRVAAALFNVDQGQVGPDEWLSARAPVRYRRFDHGLHYRAVLMLTGAVTAVAVARAAYAGIGRHAWGPAWFGWAAVAQIVAAWAILVARGTLSNSDEFAERVVIAPRTLLSEATWAFDRTYWDDFWSAVATLGLLPVTAIFWFVTGLELWGLPIAAVGSLAVLSSSVVLWLLGQAVQRADRQLLANPFPELLREAGLI